MKPKYHVELIWKNGTRQDCYDNTAQNQMDPGYKNTYGWCGVCNKKAKIGEKDYCHIGKKALWGIRSNHEATTSVTPTENWGWCSRYCYPFRGNAQAPMLQVGRVDILDSLDCVIC